MLSLLKVYMKLTGEMRSTTSIKVSWSCK